MALPLRAQTVAELEQIEEWQHELENEDIVLLSTSGVVGVVSLGSLLHSDQSSSDAKALLQYQSETQDKISQLADLRKEALYTKIADRGPILEKIKTLDNEIATRQEDFATQAKRLLSFSDAVGGRHFNDFIGPDAGNIYQTESDRQRKISKYFNNKLDKMRVRAERIRSVGLVGLVFSVGGIAYYFYDDLSANQGEDHSASTYEQILGSDSAEH